MIRRIEALNYRCLRYISQPLKDFQILIGPNASGKTTFLDVVSFLGDLLSKGLDAAITERSTNIHDLFYRGQGDRFELAVEFDIPKDRLDGVKPFNCVRYEVAIGVNATSNEHEMFNESVLLLRAGPGKLPPAHTNAPASIQTSPKGEGFVVAAKGSPDSITSETTLAEKHEIILLNLGPKKSVFFAIPDDEYKFPASTWLRKQLKDGAQQLMLNSLSLRRSSQPGRGNTLRGDGGNLPWAIESLKQRAPERFQQLIEHVRTALPDLHDIATVELPDTKHRFLQLIYTNGIKIPSWTASDGTLRMLALTLLAYTPDLEGIYLIEEPENGIHPMAMETVYQALRSVYGAQMLLATHSPVILGCASPEEVLCFSKDGVGATRITAGDKHPALQAWQGSLSLRDLYASGVLG